MVDHEAHAPAYPLMDFTREERQLYDNLVFDSETSSVSPYFLVQRNLDLHEAELSDLASFLKRTEEEGCDDFWITDDFESGDYYITVTGKAPLNVDELEVYNDLMEKVRVYERETIEMKIAQLEERKKQLENKLDIFIWE